MPSVIQTEPLDVGPWVARIESAASPVLQYVGRAIDNKAAIENGPKKAPAAFVVEPTFRATGTPNASGVLIAQYVTWLVPVLLAVRHYADPTGAKASAELKAARGQVWERMLAWMPEPDGFGVEISSGRLVSVSNAHVYYIDVFSYQQYVANVEN